MQKKYKLLIDVPEFGWKRGMIFNESGFLYSSDDEPRIPKTIVENSPQVFELVDDDYGFKEGLRKEFCGLRYYKLDNLRIVDFHKNYTIQLSEEGINAITELAKKHFGGGG